MVEDIISMIDEGNIRSYYSFETFVLKLMQHHLEEQGKELTIVGHNTRSIGDAVAPNGFDEFNGHTVIEIKFNLRRYSPKMIIERLFYHNTRHSEWQDLSEIDTIVIISAKSIPDNYYEKFDQTVDELNLPTKVILWGPKELNKIVNKNRKKSKEIANNLFSLRLETAVKNKNTDWDIERDKIIEELKEHYIKGQFSLFLGAGVSSSAGVPDWNTLLNSLFVSYITNEIDDSENVNDNEILQIANRLNNIDGASALMSARYLRRGLSKTIGETNSFTKEIADNLYKLRDKNKPIDSDLIKSIVTMCIPKRTGAKIKSIITYNFDDLVERELKKKSIDFLSIFNNEDICSVEELPVYHVHGFLPEKTENYDLLEKSTLVFSEEGYHEIYSNVYHWSNLVQLNCLRENHCLMIGLSMTDPNLRRLLDISGAKSESTMHYTFLKRKTFDDFVYSYDENKEKVKMIDETRNVQLFLDRDHSLNEEIMKELGVRIIWYNDYDDIPILINKIIS